MNNTFIFPDWTVPKNIHAIQTSRRGGYSNGNFSSFNLGKNVGDNALNVEKNMDKLNQLLPQKPKLIDQIHSDICIQLPSNKKTADALVTYQKKMVCIIRTADCLPILLTNKEGSFVAAIHAGWKGLGGSIIENTIKEIKSSSKLIAWLGPCISQPFFEVGHDVYHYFISGNKSISSAFLSIDNNKYLLSLTHVAISKLNRLGIHEISGMGLTKNYCTYKQKNNFYSYRRDGSTGRMATLIWIE